MVEKLTSPGTDKYGWERRGFDIQKRQPDAEMDLRHILLGRVGRREEKTQKQDLSRDSGCDG